MDEVISLSQQGKEHNNSEKDYYNTSYQCTLWMLKGSYYAFSLFQLWLVCNVAV